MKDIADKKVKYWPGRDGFGQNAKLYDERDCLFTDNETDAQPLARQDTIRKPRLMHMLLLVGVITPLFTVLEVILSGQ